MRVCVSFDWRDAGAVSLGTRGLQFPSLPPGPGIYRFRFAGLGQGGAYVGEASQLKRRAYHYTRPGPSQATNLRMNAEMREHLAQGGHIAVSIITEATIEIDGVAAAALDLDAASSRRLVENAILRGLKDTGTERILNRPGVGEEW
jgi:hypothetical protein